MLFYDQPVQKMLYTIMDILDSTVCVQVSEILRDISRDSPYSDLEMNMVKMLDSQTSTQRRRTVGDAPLKTAISGRIRSDSSSSRLYVEFVKLLS